MKTANEFKASVVFSKSERERRTELNIYYKKQTTLAEFGQGVQNVTPCRVIFDHSSYNSSICFAATAS